jgi:CRISPR-associated protein Cmr1
VTPILGGAPVTRQVDEVDVTRVPTIRGHLRFWWRALQRDPDLLRDPAKLFAAEAAVWGKAADESDKKGGRSSVEITVDVARRPQIDSSEIDYQTSGAYALWPAMSIKERGKEQDPAQRYPVAPGRGVRFRLTLDAPRTFMHEIKDAVRAWLLFGGYGSRTRRGLGSLAVVDDRAQRQWLPSIEDPDDIEAEDFQAEFKRSLTQLFRRDIFAAGAPAGQMPSLSGATLLIGRMDRSGKRLPSVARSLASAQGFSAGQKRRSRARRHKTRSLTLAGSRQAAPSGQKVRPPRAL